MTGRTLTSEAIKLPEPDDSTNQRRAPIVVTLLRKLLHDVDLHREPGEGELPLRSAITVDYLIRFKKAAAAK